MVNEFVTRCCIVMQKKIHHHVTYIYIYIIYIYIPGISYQIKFILTPHMSKNRIRDVYNKKKLKYITKVNIVITIHALHKITQ